jgi:hypothetical protein
MTTLAASCQDANRRIALRHAPLNDVSGIAIR